MSYEQYKKKQKMQSRVTLLGETMNSLVHFFNNN